MNTLISRSEKISYSGEYLNIVDISSDLVHENSNFKKFISDYVILFHTANYRFNESREEYVQVTIDLLNRGTEYELKLKDNKTLIEHQYNGGTLKVTPYIEIEEDNLSISNRYIVKIKKQIIFDEALEPQITMDLNYWIFSISEDEDCCFNEPSFRKNKLFESKEDHERYEAFLETYKKTGRYIERIQLNRAYSKKLEYEKQKNNLKYTSKALEIILSKYM